MKHKYLLFIPAAILLGVVLFTAGWFLQSNHGDSQNGTRNLKAFRNIDLSVMSGDVTVVKGKDYTIRYTLHGREKIKRAEVVNSTLYFDTGFDMHWKPGRGEWSVVITVPEDAVLESIRLKSTAGDISFADFTFRNGIFETTAGDVALSGVVCETLAVKTVSDDISLADSTVSQSALLETVSGDIRVNAPFNSVEAKSVGDITFNGEDQERRFRIDQGAPALKAVSVSGEIDITANVWI